MSAGHDMTCGTCGRTWNSDETPTPAARCPYEYEHAEEGPQWEVCISIRGVTTTFYIPVEHDDEDVNDVVHEIMEDAAIFVARA